MIGWNRKNRRAFLKTATATLGLPFLESLAPRAVRAAPGAPRRFITVFIPNGAKPDHWKPKTEGAGYTLSTLLEPLEAVKSDVSVLSGLANRPGEPMGAGDHSAGSGAFLTCVKPQRGEGEIRVGISLDQYLAKHLKAETPRPSLVMGIDPQYSTGICGGGNYSCAYRTNLSWRGPTTPAAKLTEPQQVFDYLFGEGKGGFTSSGTAQLSRQTRMRMESSILDYVRQEAAQLQQRLGSHDKMRMDEYLAGIRELEIRVDRLGRLQPRCEDVAVPASVADYPEKVAVMMDLMVLAAQCDVTRIITFSMGDAQVERPFPFLGINKGFHNITHNGSGGAIADYNKIVNWEIQQFARFLGKLKQVTDEDGTSALDNSAVYLSSEVGDGDAHAHHDLPVLLAGKLGGALRPGRHVVYNKHSQVGALYVALLHAFGLEVETWGESGYFPLADL